MPSLLYSAVGLSISNRTYVSATSNFSVIFVNPHTVEEENLYFVALTEVYI